MNISLLLMKEKTRCHFIIKSALLETSPSNRLRGTVDSRAGYRQLEGSPEQLRQQELLEGRSPNEKDKQEENVSQLW